MWVSKLRGTVSQKSEKQKQLSVDTRISLGRAGEELVLRHYVQHGYLLVTRNFQYYCQGLRGRQGEIDLIAWKNDVVVMVEVKTRSNLAFGAVAEQVSRRQLQNLQRSFEVFLQRFPLYRGKNARFDVAVVFRGQVEIIENAYWF